MTAVICYYTVMNALHLDPRWISVIKFTWINLLKSVNMLCNFFKSVAGRATKLMTWPPDGCNITEDNKYATVSTRCRYDRYIHLFQDFPSMLVEFPYFEKSLRQIEKSVRKSTSKMNISESYSIAAWQNMTPQMKSEHSARACAACQSNIVVSWC